nr:hypothetical protein [uncultured Flavobacterium sp.]
MIAKTTKANTSGQLPIYIRLTVDGQRFEFSSKKLNPNGRLNYPK